MEIEVHQMGGVLGLDRRYVIKHDRLEVIDGGQSRGTTPLAPEQAARIGKLADDASAAEPQRAADGHAQVSDPMTTAIRIVGASGHHRQLELRAGDEAPMAVWNLIGEVSRASGL